jgi:hypothetical protein
MPSLSDFVGKVCTINTVEVNFRFKVEQMMDYFMGEVIAVDNEFVWLCHAQTKGLNAIARKYIVNISEEQVLFDDNPEHAKIIEQYREEKPITASKTTIDPFVNPKSMADLSKKMKEAYAKK